MALTIRYLIPLVIIAAILGYALWPPTTPHIPITHKPLWEVRSIDTMKFSRDLAREKLNDPSFDQVIDLQVSNIAAAGATHVAIATPYDPEFVPILTRWVKSARAHGLHVWFRGNLAGWEGWFDYSKISPVAHTTAITDFIRSNGALFESGDIFTSCPECENGGPGDPRQTGRLDEFRTFLIDENKAVATAFRAINKNVSINYPSSNYDVAKLVMDKPTTEALGGVVGIDHYVKDPGELESDINALAQSSGGKIFVSEIGAPIPDVHGTMTPSEQAAWLDSILGHLQNLPVVLGVNYWVSEGGSTAIWNNGVATPAVAVLSRYFHYLQ